MNCELDHNRAWNEGGDTAEHNLWTGCPHDHHLKHDAGWTVTQDADGRMVWTTPTGHTYTSNPHDYRPEPPQTTESATPKPNTPAPRRDIDMWNLPDGPHEESDPAPF